MEAVGYARISTEDQSTNSIPGQVERITAYCDRNKLHLQKVFVEDGESAFTFQRTEWKDLEKYIREHKEVKYLVIDTMDRFSRAELADALPEMNKIQRRLGVKIITITDPVDLDIDDFGTDLRRMVELLFSNYELKRIKKRTSDGIYQALSSGRFVNMAPYGYLNARDLENRPILKIDEDKAFIVRMVFRLYLQGMELEEIRKHTNPHGMKLKGNSAMRSMLSNPLYAGLIRVPKRGNNPAKIVKGIHQAIISENDFWLANQRLQKKSITVQRKEDVFLRGVLKCWCGKKMTAGNSKSKSGKYHWYYLCKDHPKNYPARVLHPQFLDILNHLSIPASDIEKIRVKLNAMVESKMNNKGGDIMRTKISLTKVREMITTTQEKYLKGSSISEKVFQKVMNEHLADEQRLVSQLASLQGTTKQYFSFMDELLPKLSDIKTYFMEWPLHKQHQFINLVFDHSLIYKNGIYRTPYLLPMFAHNTQILKEKGMLIIEQPSITRALTPESAPERS